MDNIDSKEIDNLLYLDIGNTVAKAAFLKKTSWDSVRFEGKKHAADLIEWINSYTEKFSGIAISCVRDEVLEAIEHELQSYKILNLTTDLIPEELLDYETPETLGIDRFLGCFGAELLTNKAVVVIDSGTACTIDFMSSDNVYRGGMIVPGFSAFNLLLSEHAPALPFIEADTYVPEVFPGKSTRDSLSWGQAGFYRDALNKAMERYEDEYEAFDLFITGGNASKMQELINRENRLRPYLIFEGMHRLITLINQ